jgi:hypothetical protein
VSDDAFIVALGLVCGTVVIMGLLPVMRRYLELRAERKRPVVTDGLQERLDRIESAVESTAVEVERISEANRFMARLLADRSGVALPAGRPERVITPH